MIFNQRGYSIYRVYTVRHSSLPIVQADVLHFQRSICILQYVGEFLKRIFFALTEICLQQKNLKELVQTFNFNISFPFLEVHNGSCKM